MLKGKKFNFFLVVCVAGFLFWQIGTSSAHLPSVKAPLTVHTSQLDHLIYRAVQKARHSITIQIYGLSDPTLLALLQKKQKEGVTLTLFYDPKGSKDIKTYFPHCSYPVRSGGLMHRKILIVDEKLSFIGSANFTTPSLKQHDNLILGFYSPILADFLTTSWNPHGHFQIGAHELEIALLPDIEKRALYQMTTWINQAKKTIQIALFTFTHPSLTEALEKALMKGVKVEIASDAYAGKGASRKTLETLKKAGAKISLSPRSKLLHHKFAVIDGEKMIMGSANWTKAAFEKNQEILLFFPQLTSEKAKTFSKAWTLLAKEGKPLVE